MPFFYSWDLYGDNSKSDVYDITVFEEEGHVNSQSRTTIYLNLTALGKIRIKDHLVKLEASC